MVKSNVQTHLTLLVISDGNYNHMHDLYMSGRSYLQKYINELVFYNFIVQVIYHLSALYRTHPFTCRCFL